eukprot:CAMPEP_0196786942 /NCGR_PEP_ID=MMETSP1104-20130614/22314_1 /TAXON_ID=33652 /ORGANISM="Cafeteria sp., Strain Caron Lab Isolate" /LENGTH=77 /DNA_ID=CAMNT_0042157271 /DNA_START=150 /DNA_END=383 /DNA_ORIENTATION=-
MVSDARVSPSWSVARALWSSMASHSTPDCSGSIAVGYHTISAKKRSSSPRSSSGDGAGSTTVTRPGNLPVRVPRPAT